MTRDRCNFYLSFWATFCTFTPLKAQKIKKHLKISFYTGVPKIMIRWCTISETWCTTDVWTHRQTDRQTDRQTEKVTNKSGCPT